MNDNFWPVAAKDWFYLILGTITLITTIIGFFYKYFIGKKFKILSRKLFTVVTKLQSHSGKLSFVRVYMKRAERDRKDIHEDIGRMSSSMRNTEDNLHKLELKWLNELSEIKTSMAEIQTKQDVILQRLDEFR